MIVDSMTFSDISYELLLDWWNNGKGKAEGLINKKQKRKAILQHGKNNEAQYFRSVEFTTKCNNTFVVVPYSNGRSHYKKYGLQTTVFCMFHYQGRLIVGRLMSNFTSVMLFEGHVFKRYCERFSKVEGLVTKEMVKKFFKDNLLIHNKPQVVEREDSDLICKIADGILFGKIINNWTVLYKTYITMDMAKGKQVELMESLGKYQQQRYLELLGRPIPNAA